MNTQWTWPPSRAVTLYHWSWFEPGTGVVSGWSQHSQADEVGYIHFGEEAWADARSLAVPAAGYPVIHVQIFNAMQKLPIELREETGVPLAWIRALLDG